MSRTRISQEKLTASSSRFSGSRASSSRFSGSRASGSRASSGKSGDRTRKKHAVQTPPHSGASRLLKRYVRWLFGKQRKSDLSTRAPLRSSRKAVIATGSVATLALLAVVPTQVSSQGVGRDSCQEVVQSGAEISRGELASLVSISPGETNETVRGLIDVPYCLLPVASSRISEHDAEDGAEKGVAAADSERPVTVREAYPLAFDPEAWVVVNYSEDIYVGYDFAFKP